MKPKSTKDHVLELERRVDNLISSMHGVSGRFNSQGKRRVYLAKTWSDTEANYPTVGNTFGLLFLDGSVDQSSPGDKPITYSEHANPSAVPIQHGTTIDDSYVERDTPVIVVEQGNKRWIMPGGTSAMQEYGNYIECCPQLPCIFEIPIELHGIYSQDPYEEVLWGGGSLDDTWLEIETILWSHGSQQSENVGPIQWPIVGFATVRNYNAFIQNPTAVSATEVRTEGRLFTMPTSTDVWHCNGNDVECRISGMHLAVTWTTGDNPTFLGALPDYYRIRINFNISPFMPGRTGLDVLADAPWINSDYNPLEPLEDPWARWYELTFNPKDAIEIPGTRGWFDNQNHSLGQFWTVQAKIQLPEVVVGYRRSTISGIQADGEQELFLKNPSMPDDEGELKQHPCPEVGSAASFGISFDTATACRPCLCENGYWTDPSGCPCGDGTGQVNLAPYASGYLSSAAGDIGVDNLDGAFSFMIPTLVSVGGGSVLMALHHPDGHVVFPLEIHVGESNCKLFVYITHTDINSGLPFLSQESMVVNVSVPKCVWVPVSWHIEGDPDECWFEVDGIRHTGISALPSLLYETIDFSLIQGVPRFMNGFSFK